MNASVEQGIVDYLAPRLEAEEIVCAVLPGTSAGTVPNSRQSVIIVVEMPHTVGLLYAAVMRVIVSTPAHLEGIALAQHSALVKEIRSSLFWDAGDEEAEDKESALNAAIHAASEFRFGGLFFKGPVDAQDDDMWQTNLDAAMGLEGPHEAAVDL